MNPEQWARVKELFHAALEQEESRRRAFVAEASADDAVGRAEVERLLEADLESHAHAKDTAVTIAPGSRLGRYEIVAPIGAGGMGEVFRAVDTRLGRDVAIKVLPARLARDDDARRRFEREARMLAALSHPNILGIHDFGDEQGVTFAVMELLVGTTLRSRLGSGALALDTALELALQVARGLAAAHAKGIFHRDLKPENVFLPAHGPLKVLDFGLARMMDQQPMESAATTEDAFLTRPGTILGTVQYMSPEQLRGTHLDHRSDIFSFGVMFYEMVSGRLPFAAATRADIMSAILTLDPPPLPSSLAVVEPVIRGCLQKEPDCRCGSTQELVATLEGLHAPMTAATVRPVPATGAGFAASSSIAVLPFADMSRDKTLDYLCEGVAEEIINELARIPGLRVVARSSAFQFKATSGDVRHVGRSLGVETVLEGSVRVAGDRLRVATQLVSTADGYQVWSERFDRTLDDAFAVQDEIAATVARTLRARLGRTSAIAPRRAVVVPEAYTCYLRGRHHWNKRTEADLGKSVRYLKDAIDLDPGYAEAHAALGEAYATLGLYGALSPAETMPKAKAAAKQALAIDDTLPGALATVACVSGIHEWSWSDAEHQFRRAIALTPNASAARHWYAINQLVPLGRFDEAGHELREALVVDPLSAPITSGLGIGSYFAHRYEDAERELSAALADAPGFVPARYFLGLTLTEMGRYEDAQQELTGAATLSGGSPELTAAKGYAWARAGDTTAALGAVGELTALTGERYVSPSLIAQIHAGLGDLEEALAWLDKARDVRAADLAWLAVRPVFRGLHREPRFAALLRTLNLSAE